jgi:hypothetical protein
MAVDTLTRTGRPAERPRRPRRRRRGDADVCLFCTIATFAVVVAALWLVLEEKS